MKLGLKRKRSTTRKWYIVSKFCLFSRVFGNPPLSDFLEYLGWNMNYGRKHCPGIGSHISDNDNRQVCFKRVDIYIYAT